MIANLQPPMKIFIFEIRDFLEKQRLKQVYPVYIFICQTAIFEQTLWKTHTFFFKNSLNNTEVQWKLQFFLDICVQSSWILRLFLWIWRKVLESVQNWWESSLRIVVKVLCHVLCSSFARQTKKIGSR